MSPAWDHGVSGNTCAKSGRAIFWLGCITVVVAASPAFSKTQCVGRWRVSVEATSGTCKPNEHNRAILLKEDGRIVLEHPSSNLELSGNVSSCQTVSFVIARSGEIARGRGQIMGETASGTWTVTRPPTKQCSGTWFARKH
jgi:hypothetical protein